MIFQGKESSKLTASDAMSQAVPAKNSSSGTGSGHSDSTANSVTHTPSQTKKPTPAMTAPPRRNMSNVELVAELNSRLAKLTDAAASDISVELPARTKTTSTECPASSRAPTCSEESSTRAQSVPKVTAKNAERETSAVKQRNSASTTVVGSTWPEAALTSNNNNNKNSTVPHQTPVFCHFISVTWDCCAGAESPVRCTLSFRLCFTPQCISAVCALTLLEHLVGKKAE